MATKPLEMTALKAKLFRGFSDPTRLAILDLLLAGERSVSDIAQAMDATVANISAHLACLTGCGLVRSEKRGKYVYYHLQERGVRDLLRIADRMLARIAQQVYACTHQETNGKS